MAAVTNELMHELPKRIQAWLARMESALSSIEVRLGSTAGHLLAVQNDVANLYAGQANVDVRPRIERRLDIVEDPVS